MHKQILKHMQHLHGYRRLFKSRITNLDILKIMNIKAKRKQRKEI